MGDKCDDFCGVNLSMLHITCFLQPMTDSGDDIKRPNPTPQSGELFLCMNCEPATLSQCCKRAILRYHCNLHI